MDQDRARQVLSGQRRGPGARLIRACAWAASKPYAAAMRLRRALYRAGLFGSMKAPAPVISVGNVTVGGTGKTPMVAWVVKRLQEMGLSPTILTRGYKSVKGKSDEAELLWQLTQAPVVVNPDRVAGAFSAAGAGADAIVLDDGFQHRRLGRDLDIVLIDATCPFGFEHVLPRGLLREPLSVLREADAIVITRSDQASREQVDAVAERIRRLAPQASLHRAGHVPSAVIVSAGRHVPPEIALKGKRVVAFCGIGNPESFFSTLAGVGADVAERVTFNDHVDYSAERLAEVAAAVERTGAEAAITTAKDRVKVDPSSLPKPLWTLQIVIGITDGEAELVNRVRAAAKTDEPAGLVDLGR